MNAANEDCRLLTCTDSCLTLHSTCSPTGKSTKSGPRSRSPFLTPYCTRCRYARKEAVEHSLSPVLYHMAVRTLPPVRGCSRRQKEGHWDRFGGSSRQGRLPTPSCVCLLHVHVGCLCASAVPY